MGPNLVTGKGIGFFKLTSIMKIVFMALSTEYICCIVSIITPTSCKLHIGMLILAGLVLYIVTDQICYSPLNKAEFVSLFNYNIHKDSSACSPTALKFESTYIMTTLILSITLLEGGIILVIGKLKTILRKNLA